MSRFHAFWAAALLVATAYCPLLAQVPPHQPPIGPGRTCDAASLADPYVRLICTDDRLAEDWLVMNQAGYALRHQIGDAVYLPMMRVEGASAWTALQSSCPIHGANAAYDPVACIDGHILHQRSRIVARLDPAATEEATRDIRTHLRLQAALVDLHYMTDPADGSYGPLTRDAISRFQQDHGIVLTGFMTNPTAQALLDATTSRLPTSPPASALPTPQKEPSPSTEVTSGSAFFITSDGYLMTNSHVVRHCSAITVSYGMTGPSPARLIARDSTNDLAIIRTEPMQVAVATFRSGVRLGEAVAVYGFPLSGLLASSGNFTLGNVTALAGLRDDSRMLQISAPVQPGNSGGPLLDETGAVVGIVVAKLNAISLALATADMAQNVNFAIKASVAQAFAESQGISIHTAPQSGAPLRPADLADRGKSLTALVKCQQ